MKKKLLKSLFICTAVLTATVTSQVQAEEVVSEPATLEELKKQNSTDIEVLRKNIATELANHEVKQQDVEFVDTIIAEAEAELTTAKAILSETKAAKETAETTVKESKQAVDQAKKDVQDATPEALEAAKETVKAAEVSVEAAKKVVEDKQEVEKAANQKVVSQEAVVADAQSVLKAAQEEVVKAKKAVAEAQKLVDDDNSATTTLIKEKQAAVDAAQAKVKEVEEELKTAKQADAERLTNISKAKETVAEAEAEVKSKEKSIADSETVRNTITINADYLAAIKASKEKNGRIQDVNNLFALATANKSINNFISSSKDKQRLIEVNAMPDEILRDLTFFASDLINQVRTQTKSGPVTVTETGIQMSKDIKAAVLENKTPFYDLSSATTVYNKNHPYRTVATFYQLLNEQTQQAKAQLTVDELKQQIYDAIISNLFEPYDNSLISAISVLGLRETYDSMGNILIYEYHSDTRGNQSSKNHNGIALVSRKRLVEAGLTAANNEKVLTNPYNNLASEATAKQEALAAARTTLREAQKALSDLEKQVEKTPVVENTLKYAKENLTKLQSELDLALSSLNNNADLKAKVESLNGAKGNLAEKEARVSTAQAKANEETETLKKLKDTLDKAKQEVSEAKEKVKIAEQAVSTAKSDLDRLNNAEKNLEDAQATLDRALIELSTRQAELEAVQAALDIIQVYYDFIQDLKTQLVAKLGQPTQTVQKNNKGNKQREIQNTLTSSSTISKATNLPKTGEQDSYASLILGSGLAALGLYVFKRRRKEA